MTDESNYSPGRTLPHSLEAEESLISCCLIDGPEVISRCLEARLKPDSFYDNKHGIIFEKLQELYSNQKPIDIAILAEELKTSRQLDAIGGYAFLVQVSGKSATTAQTGYFIEKIREQSLLRDIIRSATSAVEDCYGFSGGIDEFVDEIEHKIFAITQNRVSDKMVPSSAVVPRALSVLQSMVMKRGVMTGLKTGLRDLDALTWGFQKSDLVILAARPSMGKTSLALNMADSIVANEGRLPTLFFSLEMTATQLMQRMLCSRSRVNMKLLRDGMLSKNGDEMNRLAIAADELAHAPLFIDDSSGISVSHIRARSRRIHARYPLGAIFVDYLQLLAPSKDRVSREQQVSEASRGLKALAKELDVPVIVLSQLNRVADKESRRPKLSDLRESGAIEQDADVVLLMSRPADSDETFQVAGDVIDVIVAKQRNGPVGELKLTFLRDITKFENYHA